ncbi:MAG TPA: hypothetical protein VHT51_09470, partial [Micropepsaceae bacterium]|nr:hypothetical protein [Micropepsaceae bacterium]
VRLGWYSVRIASSPGMAEVTNVPTVGEARALGDSYAGKAILAFLSDAEIARYRVWAEAHDIAWTERSDRDLRSVRKNSVALGRAELDGSAMPVAFPIMVRDLAIAALSIDAPVLDGPPDPDSSPFADWRAIVTQFEHLARAQPALFENPFAHLDPGTIML